MRLATRLNWAHLARALEGHALVNKERRRMQIPNDLCRRVNLDRVRSANVRTHNSAANDHRGHFNKFSFDVSTLANNERIFALDAPAKGSLNAYAALKEELSFETCAGAEQARDFRGILHGACKRSEFEFEFVPEFMCAFVLQNATKYIAFGDFADFACLIRVLLLSMTKIAAFYALLAAATFSIPAAAQKGTAAPLPAAPAAEESKSEVTPKKEVRPSAGYTYSDKVAVASHGKRHMPQRKHVGRTKGLVASFPALTQDAGLTRLTVRLSKGVEVEEKKAEGSITYVLKGAHVARRNDTHPLVAVHFNTPVSTAKLSQTKKDVEFRVTLRASVSPTYAISSDAQGAFLQVDFPAGEYLKKSEPAAVPKE
jgi:hypothetical protein